MRVLLPDGNELTLDEGASGRDAAAAIGPRLADGRRCRAGQRRREGSPPAGARRRDDPHPDGARRGGACRASALDGACHGAGGAAPVAGRQDRDRACDRRRLLLRLRISEPISADDLGRIEEEMRRILRVRRAVRARGWRRPLRALDRFRAEGQPYKLELAEGLEGRIDQPLPQRRLRGSCRGPHLQTTKPIKAFKLLSTGGRVLAGATPPGPMLTRIHDTRFPPGRPGRPLGTDRGGPAARPPPDRARARPVPFRPALAGVAAVAPARHGDLERARGPAPFRERPAGLRRGEDAAALRRRPLEDVRTLGEVPRQHVPRPRRGRGPHLRPEAHELPWAHASLPAAGGAAIASSRSATPRRRPCTETSLRGRCTAGCACGT